MIDKNIVFYLGFLVIWMAWSMLTDSGIRRRWLSGTSLGP